MSACDELADVVGSALHEDVHICTRVWEAWSHGTMSADDFAPASEDPDLLGEVADAILAAGYRKPQLIQYVVVTQNGGLYDCSFGQDRERAKAVADQATADAKSVGLDYVYRVAELVEATS